MTSLHDELEKKLQDPNATPMSLPLEFLKTITCDFSTESELGRGGYGVVYKGVLRSGKIIAVKKLFETLLKHEAFQNEISFLMGIKHQNVVQFVGYCAESKWEAIEQPSGSGRHILAEIQKRLLCFEYVSNKSLDRHIADRSLDLEWNIRYKIIIGICNGLHFLHEKCRIIHLDLKPENILMDSNMKPKIADFGLSRLFGEQESKIFTDNHVGTRGYMAPEYINQGLITKKADIFSLGVIIIEIVTGRRDYPNFQLDSPESIATSCQHFMEEVLGSWRYKFESTVKYISMEELNQQVKECISIALKCVDPVMEKRPTLKNVIQVLNAVDQMEASKELPSEMQCRDKSQVLDTNVSKELILHSVTEDMSNIKTGGTVGNVKKSQECLLSMPLWTSNTGSQNHQEAVKESSEPQQASDKTSEGEREVQGDDRRGGSSISLHGGELRMGSPPQGGGGLLWGGIGAVEHVHLKLERERQKMGWSAGLFPDEVSTGEFAGSRRLDEGLIHALGCTEPSRTCRPDLSGEPWRAFESMRKDAVPSRSVPDESSIPSHFICPIIQEVMNDPHIAADGFTYEGEAIRSWINTGSDTSPMTNLPLEHDGLIPNFALRSAIQEWNQQQNTVLQ